MPRSIWSGAISFGLLHIPVQLMTAESPSEISLRMLDRRDHSPIQFKRVNAESGKEVEWKDVVKAFEVEKGEFVPLEPEDIKRAAPEAAQTIEIERFVDRESISAMYFDKPYYLTPGKKAEKGYVLLREVLKRTGQAGVGRVVIRTREYLAAVVPKDEALMLLILRFAQELVDPADYKLPEGSLEKWKITTREIDMAKQLIESMSSDWKPEDYKDDFRERLSKVIEDRVKSKNVVRKAATDEDNLPENAATNVIDFADLLKRSLEKKGGGKPAPAKKAAKKTAAKKTTARKRTGRKSA